MPKINRRDNYRNIIRWSPTFKDFLESSLSSRGPLSCVLCEGTIIPDETIDPFFNDCHCEDILNLTSELECRMSDEVPIFKKDNAVVHMKIEEDSRGESFKSTIKWFSHHKEGIVVLFKN